jgi:hypothetical protein
MPGLVKFDSLIDLRQYLKDLMSRYEVESDRYGEKVGRLMRILEMENSGKGVKKLREVEWRRTGMVLINAKEPKRSTLEIMIEVMEDYKSKAKRTGAVLASIISLDELNIPAGGFILLYLRHGVPLRIVVADSMSPEVDWILSPIVRD